VSIHAGLCEPFRRHHSILAQAPKLHVGFMNRCYATVLVASLGLEIFLLAMVQARQREFGAMRALGASLGQLRRMLFAEATTIGGLSLEIGGVVGVGLAVPGVELAVLAGRVLVGMPASSVVSSQRLARLKVVEALREP